MISLLSEQWLPVRRRGGKIEWISPHQIGDPDLVAFAASRPDFNGALAQFMLGLLQTAVHSMTEDDWHDLMEQPPTPQQLQQWFAVFSPALEFDGDGTRFMQDTQISDGAQCGIDALLIDAAGGSAIDKNTDHFVKRDTVRCMCPHCAATALFTLQTNAPAGGAGHRTSLRGGGPLTTLLVTTPTRSLWHDLWLNILPQEEFLRRGGDVRKKDPHFIFPWLADMRKIQAEGGETQPAQVHPYHVLWAMPRRIKLDFSDLGEGTCDICKRQSEQLLRQYVTRPQGFNYKGPWRHPYSPYYATKEGLLPVHPQPGGFSYKNWLSWVMGSSSAKKSVEPAAIAAHMFQASGLRLGNFGLWVFGFDMDNMKARCWYESRFPIFNLPASMPAQRAHIQLLLMRLIEASEYAVYCLRQAVKNAWFGDGDARGDFSFIDKSFWDRTEVEFYQELKQLIVQAHSSSGINLHEDAYMLAFGEKWRKILKNKVLALFDGDLIGGAAVAQGDPRRVAEAYNNLKKSFESKMIMQILGLPLKEKAMTKSTQDKKSSDASI